MNDSIFSGRTLAWLLGIGIACFAGMMLLFTFGSELFPTSSIQPSTYSKSAIGHQAWVRLLQNMGKPVLISRNDSVKKSRGGLLILAEPDTGGDERQPIDELLQAERVLVVLPKFSANPSLLNSSWAEFRQPHSRELHLRSAAAGDEDRHGAATRRLAALAAQRPWAGA